MNVFDAIKKRSSVGSFMDKAVEEDKLRAVLEAGRLAPSANNLQESRFIVVKDHEIKKKLFNIDYSIKLSYNLVFYKIF